MPPETKVRLQSEGSRPPTGYATPPNVGVAPGRIANLNNRIITAIERIQGLTYRASTIHDLMFPPIAESQGVSEPPPLLSSTTEGLLYSLELEISRLEAQLAQLTEIN